MNTFKSKVICIAGHRHLSEKDGGVELQTHYIGHILAEAGWHVHFLSPSNMSNKGCEEIAQNTWLWRYPQKSFSFQYKSKYFENIIRQICPSVFYQRGRSQLQEKGIILKYALKNDIPFVFALSSDADLNLFFNTNAILRNTNSYWKKFLIAPYLIFYDLKYRNLLKKAPYLVVQHENQLLLAKSTLNREAIILRTLHPELKCDAVKDQETRVIWISNYRPWKRSELFFDLAKALKRLECRFEFVYGKTSDEYLKNIISDVNNCSGNLDIFGELASREAEKYIEQSSILVNTSLPYEGFPNTFVQAWLRETPTVSFEVDPGNVISREKIGYVSRDFKQFVSDVEYLIINNNIRKEMGKRARQYAEKVHGLNSNREYYVRFFNSIIQ
ncbi:MAG: glycosyltransferase family 4 protein [Candidatus Pacebacteria bacterium]|nr:glycosyltransferase family 4 protein [Candidatus Paceibacterota bacterium]